MSGIQAGLYEYLTPAVIDDFNGSGKQTLLEGLQAPELLEEAYNNVTSLIFTELLLVVADSSLWVQDAVNFMKDAINAELKAIIFCQVFDVFPHNQSVMDFVAKLHEQSVIKPSTLAQHIDSETLIKLKIVSAQTLTRQMNTRKRDEYFTQKKFNLLHEEYEGYSILINEFCTFFETTDNEFLAEHAVKVVHLLIGHYLLDPNRVLDIIIEISANYVVGNHRLIIAFLKKSLWWPQVEGDCTNGLEALSDGGCPAAVNLIALRLMKQASDREVAETYKILVSLLIKEGFVSFGLIYPFFSPSDEDMRNLESVYKSELDEKVLNASASALALAAPLAEEDTEGDSSVKNSDKSSSSPAKKTVESMLQYNMRFQMLKRFLGNGLYWPAIYILSQYPFLVHLDKEISEFMHRTLHAIIEPLHLKLSPFSKAQIAAFQQEKQLVAPRSTFKANSEELSQTFYCFNPLLKVFGSKKHIYFYSEWQHGLPILQSADDLLTVLPQFLKFFNLVLADNHSNFIKICEIVVADLNRDSSDMQKEKWFNFFRKYLLPSIGLITESTIPVDKAFEILSFFQVDDRFNLYGELYQVLAKSNPYVKIAHGKAERATKNVLKRLSKENVGPMMRRLAKISVSNPLPCFLTILQQLESYDNLNTLIVDTAEYFNSYGWDNLTLAIMMRLTSAGRSNKQANGLNERQWVTSLSSFVGKICHRFPSMVDIDTLLKYLLRSLHSSGSSDLLVLKEMLASMGGIQSINNLTPLQIDMINSGPSMQKIVFQTIGDKRYEYHHSGSLLRKSLTKNGMANEFLVLLCKLNRDLIDSTNTSHLKVLASAKDEIDSVLHLLCTLVGFFGKDSSELISAGDLIQKYNVPVVWAFEVWRYFLPEINGHSTSAQGLNALSEVFPKQISSKFFIAFWRLNLYDINYSSDRYDNELSKLKSRVSSLKEEYAFMRRDKDAQQKLLNSLKSSIEEMQQLILLIPSAKETHAQNSKLVDDYLVEELTGELQRFGEIQAGVFLQTCVLPRAVHSSFDAVYCANIIFKLHNVDISGYHLMSVLDCLFRNSIFFSTLFTCTPTESENLGIFVSAILKELNRWTTEKIFTEHTHSNQLKKHNNSEIMTFADFRENVFQYHSIILQDVSRALEVTTYMSRMNAITYFKNLLGVYPIVEDHCESIVELIQQVSKKEKRDDLRLSSSALIGHVKARKSSWVHLWDFIDMNEDAKSEQMEKRKKIEEIEASRLQKENEIKLELQRQDAENLLEGEQENQSETGNGKSRELSSNTISYDDIAKPTSRLPSRNVEAPKGRYDSYSHALSVHAARKMEDAAPEKTTLSPSTMSAGEGKGTRGVLPSGPSSVKTIEKLPEAPSGPALTKGRLGHSEHTGRFRDTLSRDSVFRDSTSRDSSSTDLFYRRQVRADTNASELSLIITHQRSPVNLVRSDSLYANERDRRESERPLRNTSRDEKPNALRSATPSAPRQTQPLSSSSGNNEKASSLTTGARAPLPPQAPPKDRSSTPHSEVKNRTPLPPQQSTRASSRNPTQPSGPARAPLPPQQPPRERPSQGPSRGYRGSSTADNRDVRKNTRSQERRPSGDPLPPPSLPPPTRNEQSRDSDSYDKKRRFGDRGWNNKRLRY